MKTWTTHSGIRIIQILSGRSNVFIVTNGEKNILVDTSVSRLRKKLVQRLDRAGFRRIDYLVLTHAHFDHAANAAWIREISGAKVIIHGNEKSYLETGDNIIPNGTNFFTRPLVQLFGRRFFRKARYEPCRTDITAGEGLDLQDFRNVYLIHTPGHTTGSMSLIVDDEIALVGDAMFGIFKGSIFPPYAEDPETMIRSWGKLLKTNCKAFLPGHGTINTRKAVERDFIRRLDGLDNLKI